MNTWVTTSIQVIDSFKAKVQISSMAALLTVRFSPDFFSSRIWRNEIHLWNRGMISFIHWHKRIPEDKMNAWLTTSIQVIDSFYGCPIRGRHFN